jgi:hypothetical protein
MGRADPVVAFGPKLGADGMFSYANGSTLYYAIYSNNISGQVGAGTNTYTGSEGMGLLVGWW